MASDFDKAVQFVRESGDPRMKNLSDEKQLEFYGFFKQANVGPCTTERPGLFDLTAKAKWFQTN